MMEEIMKVINKTRTKDQKKKEEFRKKYWKLPATERLHYDSVRARLHEEHGGELFSITYTVVKLFLGLFIFLAAIKYLLEIERLTIIKIIAPIFDVIPLVFKVVIVLDIFFFIMIHLIVKNREIKKLNVRFGLR